MNRIEVRRRYRQGEPFRSYPNELRQVATNLAGNILVRTDSDAIAYALKRVLHAVGNPTLLREQARENWSWN